MAGDDISLVKMSPGVGVGPLLEWHLHTITLAQACMRAHGLTSSQIQAYNVQ